MRFMVNHGLDVAFHAVSEAVHWVVGGCNAEMDGRDVIPVLDFLVEEAGMSANVQVRRFQAFFGGDNGSEEQCWRLCHRLATPQSSVTAAHPLNRVNNGVHLNTLYRSKKRQ